MIAMMTVFGKLIFVVGLFFSLDIYAQSDSSELENLTITATLSSMQQKETGRNIIIIRGDLFHQLPVSSLDELLRYLPGIEVQQRGPQGSQSDIVIRGGTFQQVLVIIDGIRLNDPLTGHFNSYIPIHPGEIERIEILKGAASALYGSDAVGGVIQIITKTFSQKRPDKNEIQFGLKAGGNGLLNTNGHFRVVKNNSEISGGILSDHANGEQLRGTTGFFDNTTATIAFSQCLRKNWQLNLRTAADFRSFNAQNFYTTFLSDTAKEKVRSYWQHLSVFKTEEKYSLTFNAGLKNLRDQFWFRPVSVPNDNKTQLFTTQFTFSRKLNNVHSITSGMMYQQKRIVSNDRGDHFLKHAALFVIGKHKLSDNFFINESLRTDWDDNYGLQLIPQLNLAYSFSKFTLRASTGKSIRDADFTERYNNYNKPLVTAGSIGNPDLQAERSFNIEAGIDYNFSSLFRGSASYFRRDQNDLIDWTPTSYDDMPRKDNLVPTGSYALAKNIANVKTSGWEFDFYYKKQINHSIDVLTSLGIVFLNSESDNTIPSFYISSHAKQLVNFSSVIRFRSFSLSFAGLYKKRNEQKASAINAVITPSYFIMNSRVGYAFIKKKVQLFFEATNLFNETYSDLLGSQMPGRWLSGGFQINLYP